MRVTADIIRQVFDQYAEESITEEDVQRVLSPVVAMIRAGCFDRPRRFWPISLVITMLVVVLAVVATFAGLASVALPVYNQAVVAGKPMVAPVPAGSSLAGEVMARGGAAVLCTCRLPGCFLPCKPVRTALFRFEKTSGGSYWLRVESKDGWREMDR